MTRFLAVSGFTLAALFPASAVHAQYVGPTTVPTTTVKVLKESGKDDQRAVLRGRLIANTGGDRYRFSDGTGEMTVKIKPARWPAGQKIGETTIVELAGEYDKELIGESRFDVKEIRLP